MFQWGKSPDLPVFSEMPTKGTNYGHVKWSQKIVHPGDMRRQSHNFLVATRTSEISMWREPFIWVLYKFVHLGTEVSQSQRKSTMGLSEHSPNIQTCPHPCIIVFPNNVWQLPYRIPQPISCTTKFDGLLPRAPGSLERFTLDHLKLLDHLEHCRVTCIKLRITWPLDT